MWCRFCLTIFFFSTLRTTLVAGELPSPDFENDVLPILEKNCLQCHGESAPQAQLDLRTPETVLAGVSQAPPWFQAPRARVFS